LAACEENLTIGCTATGFPPLRSAKPAREPGVMCTEIPAWRSVMEDDFELEMSPLCQKVTADGKTVEVEIYRGDKGGWLLEVVDEFGTSTVWDDEFDTDRAALEEVQATIRDEGIDALIGIDS
tara:strand:+ start:6260 stop:6628 length:369 start_codon:yes stop_codon:yes gene_type:complete